MVHTHFLSDAVVNAYLLDLRERLINLGDRLPRTWVSLGSSGDKIVEALTDLLDEPLVNELRFERLVVERGTNKVRNRESETDFSDENPKSVLLVDGPIHSGASMQLVADWLASKGVESLLSYGLVVKRTSNFIPSFFGLMIEEHDRALFQLDRIPNNRLITKSFPFGTLRTISESDVRRTPQFLNTGVTSISKIGLADLWYEHKSRGDHVYVYDIAGKVVGFVHFYRKKSNSILVDVLAVDESVRGQDIGGALMRWVENWARCQNLTEIELHSIEGRIGMYERWGYCKVANNVMDLGDGEVYHHMAKRILYNIDPDQEAMKRERVQLS